MTTTVNPIVINSANLSTVGLPNNQAILDFHNAVIVPLVDPIDPAFAREWQLSNITKPIPPALLEMYVQETLKVPARVWHEVFASLVQDDLTSELGKITAPTLIMWGDQDGFASRSNQETLVTKIPNARLIVYEGIGHAIHWEDPKRVGVDLVTFIESKIARE